MRSFFGFDLIAVHMTELETHQSLIVYYSRYKISKKALLSSSELKVGLMLYNFQFPNIFGFYNLVSSAFEACDLFRNAFWK